nr:Rab family GTPase [Candidatus Freyarchaeota archaeon]
MNDGSQGYLFKVIVVGEGGVGKTTFINRYTTQKFIEITKITIGAGFYSLDKKVNGDSVKLQVWDFGGEKRFRFILPSYCKGTSGVIFAFDLTRSSSLWNLEEWFELVKKNTNNPISLLIGTKADETEKLGAKAVKDEQIAEFLKKHNLSPNLFFKTSSKTGQNVKEVFAKLYDLLHERAKK